MFFGKKRYEYAIFDLEVNSPAADAANLDKYIVSSHNPGSSDVEALLNDKGIKGWRLVTTFVTKKSQPWRDGKQMDFEIVKGVFEKAHHAN